MIVNTYNLNMIPDRVLPLVMVSQYDSSRTIVFNLYDGENEYQPTSAKVLIGTNQYEGQVSGNQVTFNVPSSLTQTVQYLFGEIVATDSNGKMSSLNFKFKVDSTPMEVSQTNTLTLNRSLSNGLKMGLETKLEPMEEQKDEPTEEKAEPIDEPIEEVVEEPIEEEPIEEEPTEESEVEDGLVNDNTNDSESSTREP